MHTKKGGGLSNVYVLVYAAMLSALSVIIGIFCKNFLNLGNGLFRITFENFPIILSGIAFGPVVGACVGAVSDSISFMLSTQIFAISPIVTLGAATIGALSGIVSRYVIKRDCSLRIILSVVIAHLIGSVIIKSVGLFVYYGWLVLWRIPTYALISTLESLLLCYLYKSPALSKIFKLRKEKR
jgi:ECF transporter S component (folate family)